MNDFKIGDRVRVIDAPCPEWMQNMPALPDTIFKVEGMQNDKLILSRGCSDLRFIVDAKHFELVETPDQPKNMTDMSFEPMSEAEAYIVNQAFGDSYIRASKKCFDIKGELKEPDPKTAFLTELQSLLRKYDAKIHVWAGYNGDKVLIFELKDNNDIFYPNEWLNDYKFVFPITPDNIFNYDKE